MGSRMSSFLQADSIFGKTMNRIAVICGANVLFILFSLPVVTAGPAFAALYHVMLKACKNQWDISPLHEFLHGFKSNFKQAFAFWMFFLLFVVLSVMDIRYMFYLGDSVRYLRYLIYAVDAFVLLVTFYIYPVMAAFSDTLPHLLRNAMYFAGKNLVRMGVVLLLNIAPFIFTYADIKRLPLYSFLWAAFGFAGIAAVISKLLYQDFILILEDKENKKE